MKSCPFSFLVLLLVVPGTWAAEPLKPRQSIDQPARTTMTSGTFEQTRITVKFRDDLPMRIREGKLSPEGFPDEGPAGLTARLEQAGAVWERTHAVPESTLRRMRDNAQRNTGKAMPDLNSSFIIRLGNGQNPEALINELNALDFVELAEPLPLPGAPLVAPDYTGDQGYLRPATAGINAEYAWTVPGGTGTGVRIADIEQGYDPAHADLSLTLLGPAVVVPDNPPLYPALEHVNHGTAVLGVPGSKNNEEGTTGIAHGSSLFFAAANTASGYTIASAITVAAAALGPGDLILIEQHLDGPAPERPEPPRGPRDWLPVEWNKTIYDAIVLAVGNGIIVVEAAGNGGLDLDAAAYDINHKPFRPENDSGAIMVGAGVPNGANARSRLGFSNYGRTVDLQGCGQGVAT